MKTQWLSIRKHLRTFIACYIIFFFVQSVVSSDDWYQKLSTYIAPVFGSLFFTLFMLPDAVWPIYKRGDKVWWSTYGEEDPNSNGNILQKRIIRFVGSYCFMFTLEIFQKKAPIYLSMKDYLLPGVFSLGIVLFLSRDAIWPIYREKPTESHS